MQYSDIIENKKFKSRISFLVAGRSAAEFGRAWGADNKTAKKAAEGKLPSQKVLVRLLERFRTTRNWLDGVEDENRPTIQLGKKSYTLSKLANRVADLLDGRPVTYLSDHLGVTVEKIIETLSENKKIEDYLLHNIAEALGVNKDNLYERSNSKNVKENNKTYKTNPQSISNETLLLIQQWLDEAEQLRPGQKIWFQIEFENRFPEYSHWLEKKRAGNDH